MQVSTLRCIYIRYHLPFILYRMIIGKVRCYQKVFKHTKYNSLLFIIFEVDGKVNEENWVFVLISVVHREKEKKIELRRTHIHFKNFFFLRNSIRAELIRSRESVKHKMYLRKWSFGWEISNLYMSHLAENILWIFLFSIHSSSSPFVLNRIARIESHLMQVHFTTKFTGKEVNTSPNPKKKRK